MCIFCTKKILFVFILFAKYISRVWSTEKMLCCCCCCCRWSDWHIWKRVMCFALLRCVVVGVQFLLLLYYIQNLVWKLDTTVWLLLLIFLSLFFSFVVLSPSSFIMLMLSSISVMLRTVPSYEHTSQESESVWERERVSESRR